MAPNLTVLYLGIAIILFGVGVWAFRQPAATTENTIKFLGFEVTLNTQAFVVMAFGVVLLLVSTQLPTGIPDPHPQPTSASATTLVPMPAATPPIPAPAVQPSQPTAPLTKTYRICVGEYESACRTHDAYVYCGTDLNTWARPRCDSYRIVSVTTYSGNKCGYGIADVFCDGPH
jgi:hypothetical protein